MGLNVKRSRYHIENLNSRNTPDIKVTKPADMEVKGAKHFEAYDMSRLLESKQSLDTHERAMQKGVNTIIDTIVRKTVTKTKSQDERTSKMFDKLIGDQVEEITILETVIRNEERIYGNPSSVNATDGTTKETESRVDTAKRTDKVVYTNVIVENNYADGIISKNKNTRNANLNFKDSDLDSRFKEMKALRNGMSNTTAAIAKLQGNKTFAQKRLYRQIYNKDKPIDYPNPPVVISPPLELLETVIPPVDVTGPTTIDHNEHAFKSFSGNPVEFQHFWDTFYTHVHNNTSFTPEEKLRWLRNHLQGPALSAIVDLPLTPDNYEVALGALWNRFGMRHKMIMTSLDKLLSLPRVSSVRDRDKIGELHHNIGKYMRNLTGLHLNTVLISAILSKLPEIVRLKLLRAMPRDGPWNVETFLRNLGIVLDMSSSEAMSSSQRINQYKSSESKSFGIDQGYATNPYRSKSIRGRTDVVCSFEPSRTLRGNRVHRQRSHATLQTLKKQITNRNFLHGSEKRMMEKSPTSMKLSDSKATCPCFNLSAAKIEMGNGMKDHSITFKLWPETRAVS